MFRHLRPCTSSVCQPAQSPRSAAAISPAASVAASSAFPACKTFCHADRSDLSSCTTSAATYTSLTDFADAHASRQFLVLTLLSLSLSFYCIVSASLPRPTSAGASNPMLGVPFRVDHRIAHACFLFFSNYCFAFVHFGW